MSSTITQVVSIRVKNETAEFFKGKPLNRIVENVHALYKREEIGITKNGEIFVPSSHDKWKDSSV